jgi:lipopolysaccharide export system protein LptA
MISVDNITGSIIRLLSGVCLAMMMSYAGVTRAEEESPANTASDLAHINADNMKYDMKSGISTYTGNVRFTYKGIDLNGDKVTIKQQNNEIEQLDVSGNPARYRQSVDNGETVMAESLEMTYSARSKQLILTNNARLEQAGHIVESQRIIYDTVQEVVIAGQINPQDRVNITLTPKKETPETPVPAPKSDTEGER